MADNRWVVRRAAARDGPFLADMLVEAADWSADWKKKSRRRVLSAPATAHYIVGWPRDTDLGVIAEADRAPVGAAWLLYLSEGYQVVDSSDAHSDTMVKNLASGYPDS